MRFYGILIKALKHVSSIFVNVYFLQISNDLLCDFVSVKIYTAHVNMESEK